MVEEPPTNDRLHVEVVSTSARSILHSKVLHSISWPGSRNMLSVVGFCTFMIVYVI